MSEYYNSTRKNNSYGLKPTKPGKSGQSKIDLFSNCPNWIYRVTIIVVLVLIVVWLLSLELRLDSKMDTNRSFRLFFDRLGVENLNL